MPIVVTNDERLTDVCRLEQINVQIVVYFSLPQKQRQATPTDPSKLRHHCSLLHTHTHTSKGKIFLASTGVATTYTVLQLESECDVTLWTQSSLIVKETRTEAQTV